MNDQNDISRQLRHKTLASIPACQHQTITWTSVDLLYKWCYVAFTSVKLHSECPQATFFIKSLTIISLTLLPHLQRVNDFITVNINHQIIYYTANSKYIHSFFNFVSKLITVAKYLHVNFDNDFHKSTMLSQHWSRNMLHRCIWRTV